MKKIMMLILIICLIAGCTDIDDKATDDLSLDESAAVDVSVPDDSIEPIVPEEVDEPSLPEETAKEPATSPENDEIVPEEDDQPEAEADGADYYGSSCTTEIPSEAEFIDKSSSPYTTYYKMPSGEFIGPYWKYYDNGKTIRLSFRCYDEDGDKTGPVADWDKEGNLEEEYFLKDGRFDGPYKSYRQGILIEDLYYKNGEKHGVWTYYSDDGTIKAVESYDSGKSDGIWSSYEDGRLRMEQEYEMGVKTPNIKMYYADGSLQSEREGKTVDNKFTGTYTTWQRPDKNGVQLGKECTFLAGIVQECREI